MEQLNSRTIYNMNLPVQKLQKIAAREFNYLLSESPSQIDGSWDFGWFCREHAFCTVIVGKVLGICCDVVRGDFLIRTNTKIHLSSIGMPSDHAWCQTADIPVLDLSLHFRLIWPEPQIDEPIISLGRNGIFDVRFLPETTSITATLDGESIIGYIPRTVFRWSALELLSTPSILLPTKESAQICERVALHTIRVIYGKTQSLIGKMNQFEALAHLRHIYPNAQPELHQLLDTSPAAS